ncbi:MAG: glycosyltransferase family 4 protein [Planctomycetia bacterium]|nr:glycosyltransferase family 4 protein [Planctomycetia bacterium]
MEKLLAFLCRLGLAEREIILVLLYTHRRLKFPFCATFCEPWCQAPTADGTGNFNAKYYKTPVLLNALRAVVRSSNGGRNGKFQREVLYNGKYHKSMKKIRMYQRYWGPLGGGQRFLAFIAQILSENNEVEILHHAEDFDLKRFEEGMEVDLSRVQFRCVPRLERPQWTTNNPMKRLMQEASLGREWSEGADVFLESSDIPPVFNRSKHGILLTHFPLIGFEEFCGHTLPEWGKQNVFKRLLKKQYQGLEWRCRFSSYHTYLCNSQFTRRWCFSRWGISPQILNPPLRSGIQPAEKIPLILSMGAFSKENHKRQDILIHAFQNLCDMHPDICPPKGLWNLRLIGPCKDNDEDRDFVERLRLKAQGYPIEIRTNVDGGELLESLAKACFVWHAMGYGVDEQRNPGRTEHFGMVATEAQAAGAIPMVFHAGGLPEIVHHGRDGILWSTIPELVKTTFNLIYDPEYVESMRENALKNSTNYNDAAFRARLAHVLRGVVDVKETTGKNSGVKNGSMKKRCEKSRCGGFVWVARKFVENFHQFRPLSSCGY